MGVAGAINGTAHESSVSTEVSRRSRCVATIGILLLVASVSLNVVLARRVSSFANSQSIKASGLLLKVGTAVPPIVARRLDGSQALLSYQAKNQPTVLYVFTPPCVWCARNMDNLKTLLDKEGGQYSFIGLSLSERGLADYISKNNLILPVYSGLSPETLATYKLGSTPQTIVISPDGKVLQDWAGAYVGEQKSQIEAFFHVALPGIRPGS